MSHLLIVCLMGSVKLYSEEYPVCCYRIWTANNYDFKFSKYSFVHSSLAVALAIAFMLIPVSNRKYGNSDVHSASNITFTNVSGSCSSLKHCLEMSEYKKCIVYASLNQKSPISHNVCTYCVGAYYSSVWSEESKSYCYVLTKVVNKLNNHYYHYHYSQMLIVNRAKCIKLITVSVSIFIWFVMVSIEVVLMMYLAYIRVSIV